MASKGRIAVIIVAFASLGALPFAPDVFYRLETGPDIRFYGKRFSCWPGPDFTIPAQPCQPCLLGSHGTCLRVQAVGARYLIAHSSTTPRFPEVTYKRHCNCCKRTP